MDFIDQPKQFSECVESMKGSIQTEEATKTAIIMSFSSMFGHDVFNPQELVPKFTVDVRIKKGGEVDYAIIRDGQPVTLIECKSISEDLGRHDSQLFRYSDTTTAKFAILTNGIVYRFYTSLDSLSRMNDDPSLTINILGVRENQAPELKKFSKSVFDTGSIFSTASELKYVHELKYVFTEQLDTPTDGFICSFLQGCYLGLRTQNAIEKLRPVLRKALNDLISEMMNDKIKTALGDSDGSVSVIEQKPVDDISSPSEDSVKQEKRIPNIVTTEEELEAFFITKDLLADLVDVHKTTYKDTESYISIPYKGNIRKWICRLRLTDNQKTLIVPDEDKKGHESTLSDIYELRNYRDTLTEVSQRYL